MTNLRSVLLSAVALTLLGVSSVAADKSAGKSELRTALGIVEIQVTPGSAADENSLNCITAQSFYLAHTLAADLGIVDERTTLPQRWKIQFKQSFQNSSLRLRSGESALFHTALMSPPADIYVDLSSFREPKASLVGADGIACRGWSQSLVTTLIHEVAHGLEFALMGEAMSHRLRWHAEGFAMWFEREYRRRHFGEKFADNSILDNSIVYSFSAGHTDYNHAARIYEAIVAVIGVDGLVSVYRRMSGEKWTLERALKQESDISLPIYLWLAGNSPDYFK
jgi:hypothetical protein